MTSNRSDPGRGILLVIQILLAIALIAALTLSAIQARNAPPTTPAPTSTENVSPPALSTATAAGVTAAPTLPPTPAPTETPVPTATTVPSPTAFRETITLMGQGDAVVYPQKWIGPALVRVNSEGSGPLVIWTQDNNAQRVDLVAQSEGAYRGSSFIDFIGAQRTLRFEVRTASYWQIDVMALSLARHEKVPGIFRGQNDEAVVLEGLRPDLLTVEASTASGSLIIWAYGAGRTQVLTTTAPYTGTIALPGDTTALAVEATGPWSLEITTR